jgi:hypothetical protein
MNTIEKTIGLKSDDMKQLMPTLK